MLSKYSVFVLVLVFLWQTNDFELWFKANSLTFGQIYQAEQRENITRNPFSRPIAMMAAERKTDFNSMIFVGDVLLARNVEYLMRSKGGDYPFEGIALDKLSNQPAIVGNFEAAVPNEHSPTPINQINFSVATTSLPYLEAANFTHLSLSNNHSFDFEQIGLESSREALQQHFEVFGDPQSVDELSRTHLTVSGHNISLIGINALNQLDLASVRKLLHQESITTDFQIVYVHWGDEYALRNNATQKQLAEAFVSFGADVIIGHHPHVVQGVDLISGVPVFYSLGNYIFDQYFSKDVQEGLILSLSYSKDLKISLIPVTSRSTLSQPNFMSPKHYAEFLQIIAGKSHVDLREQIKAGSVTIDLDIASSDKVAMMQGAHTYVQQNRISRRNTFHCLISGCYFLNTK